ncbi:MAG: 16S rRNA (guanine(527)-N(7))-methyltransferase RsmG [Lachnospiraceae bacterium]|nr:16S rRNA (guanine(527)-N(7))-methyltransferase RsmG [Lachnospiraceae bacterium]
MNFKESFQKAYDHLNMKIPLTGKEIDLFERYYHLLNEWNKKINLTAIKEMEDVIQKHFIDSIVLLKYFAPKQDAAMIDIGTGAGFPGIPLKILRPDLKLTLLDSVHKKLHFLEVLSEELSLSGISFLHGRAEDFAHEDDKREKYDYCVSRAVADLSVLSELCLPFVKTGGCFISYKSANCFKEIKNASGALSILGGTLKNSERFSLCDDQGRSLLFIEKTGKTPSRYPRKAGLPAKKPLS